MPGLILRGSPAPQRSSQRVERHQGTTGKDGGRTDNEMHDCSIAHSAPEIPESSLLFSAGAPWSHHYARDYEAYGVLQSGGEGTSRSRARVTPSINPTHEGGRRRPRILTTVCSVVHSSPKSKR
ncbi:hypothetical protein BDN70DRAFT_76223 [Pholiota conissans]|uniref:Uncharacterized protein n=1 Tax=Pholiota conissans TaxID=109636 RepID=A0A9P5YY77_9AGAR|nr:hypothetical protein BDN70DRAFT_76223 [Pholiota conissans]